MKYRVKSPVTHGVGDTDHRRYDVGEEIELNTREAAPLLESGAIEYAHQPVKIVFNPTLDALGESGAGGEIEEAFTQVKSVAKRAVARIEELDGFIRDRQTSIEELTALPLTKPDYIALVRGWVQKMGRPYLTHLQRELKKADVSMVAANRAAMGINFLTAGRGVDNQTITADALCFFFEEDIVAGLARGLDSLPWPEDVALSLADRRAKVEGIEQEIQNALDERFRLAALLSPYEVQAQ